MPMPPESLSTAQKKESIPQSCADSCVQPQETQSFSAREATTMARRAVIANDTALARAAFAAGREASPDKRENQNDEQSTGGAA